jgi:ribose 5-phosphate isomerase B
MKIAIATDHAGLELKEKIKDYLKSKNIEVLDFGANSKESVHYPDYVVPLVRAITNKEAQFGILICGTGIGMSIAANKFQGIYAALVHNEFTAKMAKEHNNANILVLGAKIINADLAIKIIDTFLTSTFIGDRHNIRIEKIKEIEKKIKAELL